MIHPLSIPSPHNGVWHVAGFPIRGYALSILSGVIIAVVIAQRRWARFGGGPGQIADIAAFAVPIGVVGGRIYHVVTNPEDYFGKHGHVADIPKVWQGGLGIWGGMTAGVFAGIWLARRRGYDIPTIMLACAPALPVAQAIGRIGNWFNQELYGKPTDLPWGLEIDPENRPARSPLQATYQPTFLYELIWDLGVAGVVLWAARRWRLSGPRAIALYVLLYCIGRAWIEALRIDIAHQILGIRLNVFTALVGVVLSGAYLLATRGQTAPEGLTAIKADQAAPAEPADV